MEQLLLKKKQFLQTQKTYLFFVALVFKAMVFFGGASQAIGATPSQAASQATTPSVPYDLSYPHGALVSGESKEETSLSQALLGVANGSVVIVSELHGHSPHHGNQQLVIKQLRKMGFNVSVGMEFIPYTKQGVLDEYLDSFLLGTPMDDEEFLKAIGWGGNDFDNWKPQVLFPVKNEGWTIGLNSPRSLSGRVAKVGLEGLTPEEKKILPPNFQIGNDQYRERFREIMGGHRVPEEALNRYFAAQSLWDDTMAWKAVDYLSKNQDQVLVILVGDFHVSYGGGLPDRLRARGVEHTLTISQINTHNLSREEQDFFIESPRWGVRSDFIWISNKKISRGE